MKKIFAICAVASMLFSQSVAFAAPGDVLDTINLTAVATFAGIAEFDATLVDAAGAAVTVDPTIVKFGSVGANVVKSSTYVKVAFNHTGVGYKTALITTNNSVDYLAWAAGVSLAAKDHVACNGLLGQYMEGPIGSEVHVATGFNSKAPIKWAVFDTIAAAAAYDLVANWDAASFLTDPVNTMNGGNSIDTPISQYLNAADPAVLVSWMGIYDWDMLDGVAGSGTHTAANYPNEGATTETNWTLYNNSWGMGIYNAGYATFMGGISGINAQFFDSETSPTLIDDGDVYLALAADFSAASSQEYAGNIRVQIIQAA